MDPESSQAMWLKPGQLHLQNCFILLLSCLYQSSSKWNALLRVFQTVSINSQVQ